MKTETVEDYFGITTFNESAQVEILKELGRVYETVQVNESIKVEHYYKIFEFTFGIGLNKKKYLITSPFQTKSFGVNKIYLRKLHKDRIEDSIEFFVQHQPERKIIREMFKEQEIPKKKHDSSGYKNVLIDMTEEERFYELLDGHLNKEPIFFAEINGVPEEELEKLSTDDWEQIVHDFLFEGVEKNDLIELIYKSDLMEVNPALIEPKRFMQYNSHELIFTDSKTGKSTTAGKTGIKSESARVANLLGFSTAQETIPGFLDGQTKQFTIDEIQDERDDQLHEQLSSYMEQGEYRINKGKKSINGKGYAGIRWQGNPKEKEVIKDGFYENKDGTTINFEESMKVNLLQKFQDCLTTVTSNYSAFGSRISIIVFRLDLGKAQTKNVLTLKKIEQNEAIVRTVLDKAKEVFTKLFFVQEVLDWMHQDLDEHYCNELKKIEEQIQFINIREFVAGHRDKAEKHLRGKAFKLACADYALQLSRNELPLQEILEKAEEYVNQIEAQNLASLGNLLDYSQKEKSVNTFIELSFQGLPIHLKILFESIHRKITDLEELTEEKNAKTEFFMEDLKAYFPKINPEKQKEWKLSKEQIKERLTKNLTRTNDRIKQFGVKIELIEIEAKEYRVVVENARLFNILMEVLGL